ncbi:replication initiator [Kitasatospora aureofaciens]|uniref:replication initiator n=1 Tax=Kitasatospora aureofaciens TaxID=1894 RepID=UPI003823DD0F
MTDLHPDLLDLRAVASPAARDLIHLANRDDFDRIEATIERLAGCTRPIQLTGHTATFDKATGELLRHYSSAAEPLGRTLIGCGNRRATVVSHEVV